MTDHHRTSPGDMARVTILVIGGSSLMSVASALDPLRAANRLARRTLYDWQTVSLDGAPVPLSSGIVFPVSGRLDPDAEGDILVVIAGFDQERHAPDRSLRQFGRIARRFTTICAVEAGTWLLARSGIITSHAVTTHWEDFENLGQRFPALDIRRDRFVIDNRIWTCGGASPAFDMMLHLIRSRDGASLALDVASVFIYDEAHAPTDAQPGVSLGRLSREEPRISAAVRLMERSLDAPLPVSTIARRAGLSMRMMELLFRRHLGESPGRFFLQLRLQAARKLVLDTALPLQEIAIRTGFSSQSVFSRSFSARYGQSPRALRLQRRAA